MFNLNQVQAYIDVYYSQHGLINSPKVLATNTKNEDHIFFIWHDDNEDSYCINDILGGEIGPTPCEIFNNFEEAKAYLASL